MKTYKIVEAIEQVWYIKANSQEEAYDIALNQSIEPDEQNSFGVNLIAEIDEE